MQKFSSVLNAEARPDCRFVENLEIADDVKCLFRVQLRVLLHLGRRMSTWPASPTLSSPLPDALLSWACTRREISVGFADDYRGIPSHVEVRSAVN